MPVEGRDLAAVDDVVDDHRGAVREVRTGDPDRPGGDRTDRGTHAGVEVESLVQRRARAARCRAVAEARAHPDRAGERRPDLAAVGHRRAGGSGRAATDGELVAVEGARGDRLGDGVVLRADGRREGRRRHRGPGARVGRHRRCGEHRQGGECAGERDAAGAGGPGGAGCAGHARAMGAGRRTTRVMRWSTCSVRTRARWRVGLPVPVGRPGSGGWPGCGRSDGLRGALRGGPACGLRHARRRGRRDGTGAPPGSPGAGRVRVQSSWPPTILHDSVALYRSFRDLPVTRGLGGS